MKRFKMLAVLALTAMVMYSCGDSDSDNPADSGGNGDTSGAASKGSLSTHTGTNTAVTESNVTTVNSKVTSMANSVFGRAMSTVKYAKTAKPAAQSFNLDGKVNGNKSGYAQVKGTYTINMNGQSLGSYSYNFTCTYYDFADDSSMYMGGQVTYTGTGTMSSTNSIDYNITAKGGLKFNGDYEGAQDFTLKYTLSGTNYTWTYTTTTTSGGKTFSGTYKYPQ